MEIEDFIYLRVSEERNTIIRMYTKNQTTTSAFNQMTKLWDVMVQIVEWHRSWPVMVETMPEFEGPGPNSPVDSTVVYRMTQQIQWMTQQNYIETFGKEPPSAPFLRLIAALWSNHADYRDEWAL